MGNSSILRGGTTLGEGGLVGVLTTPPTRTADRTSWFGSPALELPRIPDGGDPTRTTDPPRRLVVARAATELIRILLPGTVSVALAALVYFALVTVAGGDGILAMTAAAPCALLAAGFAATAQGHENFVQVLDSQGRILAATPGLRTVAPLKGKRLTDALRRSGLVTRGKSDPLPDGSRLLATPVRTQHHGSIVLIVGTSLDQRSSSLSNLVLVLAIVGPLALIVASFAAYRVASAALAPVELMRRRAAAVSASEPGLRLPLPLADDEIRRLGITLNEMLERLEQSFAHERSFVANASHELRTPLATLKTELDLALRRQRPPEELRDALRSAQDEVDRLTDLADDLLVLGRADEGQLPIRRADLDLGQLLGEVRDRLDPTHDRVALDVPAGMHVVADPQGLQQAVGNLPGNALRYSAGLVTLGARAAHGGGVELHVEDDGPGFPSDFIEQGLNGGADDYPSSRSPRRTRLASLTSSSTIRACTRTSLTDRRSSPPGDVTRSGERELPPSGPAAPRVRPRQRRAVRCRGLDGGSGRI